MSIIYESELYHYGVKGMKWGVRRYQNQDGSLTEEGQKRLVKSLQKSAKSRSARKDITEGTSKMLREELENEASFKEYANKLRKLTAQFEKIVDDAYYTDKYTYSRANEAISKAWDEYVLERNKTVDMLLGKYADTEIKVVRGNKTQITNGKLIAKYALDDMSDWRYRGLD